MSSDIRLKNALTQMVNTYSGGQSRAPIRRHRSDQGESWSVMCEVDTNDAQRLRKVMQNELDYYNTLVDATTPTLHLSPEKLLTFTENHIAIFGILAERGVNLRDIRKNEVPDYLKTYEKYLFDDSITELMKIIMEVAYKSGAIHPSMRKAMVREVMKFQVGQARMKAQSMSKSLM